MRCKQPPEQSAPELRAISRPQSDCMRPKTDLHFRSGPILIGNFTTLIIGLNKLPADIAAILQIDRLPGLRLITGDFHRRISWLTAASISLLMRGSISRNAERMNERSGSGGCITRMAKIVWPLISNAKARAVFGRISQ